MSSPREERDCTDRCKSLQHGDLICAAVSKRAPSDSELCSYLNHVCSCCETVKDSAGRTVMHVAASCGRVDVVKWLLQCRHANINIRDLESGYAALHRSLFYGKIHVAVLLMKLGAQMNLLDSNDLTALQHAVRDNGKPCDAAQAGEVYVWGSNTNYTLGPQKARLTPELLDAFHREHPDVCIESVCLDKFHCMLLASDGKVFSCGHGQGGRLGQNSEQTVLTPQPVRLASSGLPTAVSCKQLAIARDHSVFLTDSNRVWTCGLNTHYVLGLQPPIAQLLVPRPLPVLQNVVTAVCAAQYHTIAWGTSCIYAWGLNGGQIGHDRTQKYLMQPKVISNFADPIRNVATSIGATAVVTSTGDVFVLHEYQTRKIASRQLDVSSIGIIGGKLSGNLNGDATTDNELRVVLLSVVGNVFVWQESDPQLCRCTFSVNRLQFVKQVHLNARGVLYVTSDGEAFQGVFKPRKNKELGGEKDKSAFHKFLDRHRCVYVKISQLANIHRAVAIHSDPLGENFASIQYDPKLHLSALPEVSPSKIQEDFLHLLQNAEATDVTFEIAARLFPAHRYVVANKSSKLEKLMVKMQVVTLTNIDADIFEQLLLYVYTNSCALTTTGKCPEHLLRKSAAFSTNQGNNDDEHGDDNNRSAFEVYSTTKIKKDAIVNDPVRLLQDAAKKLGVLDLQKHLSCFEYSDGCVKTKDARRFEVVAFKYKHEDFPHLYDVQIKSKNGVTIPAHRCVLVARLEYFSNLFSARWTTASKANEEVSLPISSNLLELLLAFLYTDDLPDSKGDDLDAICNLLVLADEFFISRLKETCECSLSKLLTLKNAAQMLSFASVYNASQLKICCMEYVCLNLAAVLEARSLETCDGDVLEELSGFYCEWNPAMCLRVITPYANAPCDEIIREVHKTHPALWEEKVKRPQKKRTRSYKSNNELQHSIKSHENKDLRFDDDNNDDNLSSRINETTTIVASRRLQAIQSARDLITCEEYVPEFVNLCLLDEAFPELSTASGSYSKSPGRHHQRMPPKLSQRQRKRLSSSSSESGALPLLEENPTNNKNPWKICDVPSSSPQGSPQEVRVDMSKIISDEKTQRVNYTKMKTKQLIFTQIEDKALEELARFYNKDNVQDEIIITQRVPTELVASPVWVHRTK